MSSAQLRLVPEVARPQSIRSLPRGLPERRAQGDLLSQVFVAALVADRGPDGACRVLEHRHARARHARVLADLLAMVENPLRLRDLPDRVDGVEDALAVYDVARLAIDGERAAGRVFLEDLAETLLLPPTLVRWFEERSHPAGVRA
ncbi:MAG: DUF533 domain-containing protein [Pseudomonadales bacterium]